MANFSSDTYTKQTSLLVRDRQDGNNVSGRIVAFKAKFTTTAAWAAADVLDIVQLPVGATLLVQSLRVSTDGVGGTGCTIAKIGDALDDDRYSATAVALTAAGTHLAVTGVNANAIAPYEVLSTSNVVKGVLALSSGSVTADKVVYITGSYLLP